jgi:hypothetical protein
MFFDPLARYLVCLLHRLVQRHHAAFFFEPVKHALAPWQVVPARSQHKLAVLGTAEDYSQECPTTIDD